MHYVITDLHGEYSLFKEMLEKINFSDDDVLYILGDCCDRGDDSAKIYQDIMKRKNVFALMGNHEEMAIKGIEYILKTGSFPDYRCNEFDIRLWIENGGGATINSLYNLPEEEIRAIYEYMLSLPYYMEVKVGKREFVLVHAGLSDFDENKPLSEYSTYEMVWHRPNFNTKLWSGDNKYLIVGHTPTFTIQRGASKPKIYRGQGDIIAIDCGATYVEFGGSLACLCLENMEVQYVSK